MAAEVEASMAHNAQRLVRVPILYHEAHHAMSDSSGVSGTGNPNHGGLAGSFPPIPAYYTQFAAPPHSQHSTSSSLNSSSAPAIVSPPRTSQLASLV